MAEPKGEIYEASSFSDNKEIKNYDSIHAHDYKGGGKTGSMKPPSSTISSSKIYNEQACKSTSTGNESTLVFEGNSKCFEADVQSSVKSEISTNIVLPHRNGNFETDAMTHDSQHGTESSCSNSLPAIPLSNHSYQETSKEAYSFKNHFCSTDSSNSKVSDRRSEEQITASLESKLSGQIARTAISNARSKNSSSIVGNHYSLLTKKNEEISDKTKSDFQGNESSESSLKDHDSFVVGFDLNEDINENGMDDFIQPSVELESKSSHSVVIHVVAKSGTPRGLPVIPLKFEGARNWKGSAETSAFKSLDRKIRFRDNSRNEPQSFTGIDLNVAACEDSSSNGDSHAENCSKRTENLSFDLNCLYDASNEFAQPSLLRESENHPLMDLNTSLGDTTNNFHWLGTKNPDSENRAKRDFNFTNDAYLSDLSSVQHFANHAHPQQYLVAAPIMQRVVPYQPNLPYLSHALPPQSYPLKGPFHFGNMMPYSRYPNEHGIFHGPQNFVQVAHGYNTSNTEIYTPRVDLKTQDLLSRSGNKMDEARQYMFLANNTPMDEHMKSLNQEAYAMAMKRKEPEGGLEYYQLGYRQVT